VRKCRGRIGTWISVSDSGRGALTRLQKTRGPLHDRRTCQTDRARDHSVSCWRASSAECPVGQRRRDAVDAPNARNAPHPITGSPHPSVGRSLAASRLHALEAGRWAGCAEDWMALLVLPARTGRPLPDRATRTGMPSTRPTTTHFQGQRAWRRDDRTHGCANASADHGRVVNRCCGRRDAGTLVPRRHHDSASAGARYPIRSLASPQKSM
jgi:hypothetical protein